MTTTDWREHATPEAQRAFADAQYRLDNLNFGEEGYTREQAEADRELTDRYDRLVLQPAHDEFERQSDEAEFARAFPEPADGGRIEFGYGDGFHAAYRQDQAKGNGDWWLYGKNGGCYSWRRLIGEFELKPGDITYLADAARLAPLEELARWLVSLTDPTRRPVADAPSLLGQIIDRARQALGEKE